MFHLSRYQECWIIFFLQNKSLSVSFFDYYCQNTEMSSHLKFCPARFCTAQNLVKISLFHHGYIFTEQYQGSCWDFLQTKSTDNMKPLEKSFKNAKITWWKSKLEKSLALTCVAQDIFLHYLPNWDNQTIIFLSSNFCVLAACSKQTLGSAAVRIHFMGYLQVKWANISTPLHIF